MRPGRLVKDAHEATAHIAKCRRNNHAHANEPDLANVERKVVLEAGGRLRAKGAFDSNRFLTGEPRTVDESGVGWCNGVELSISSHRGATRPLPTRNRRRGEASRSSPWGHRCPRPLGRPRRRRRVSRPRPLIRQRPPPGTRRLPRWRCPFLLGLHRRPSSNCRRPLLQSFRSRRRPNPPPFPLLASLCWLPPEPRCVGSSSPSTALHDRAPAMIPDNRRQPSDSDASRILDSEQHWLAEGTLPWRLSSSQGGNPAGQLQPMRVAFHAIAVRCGPSGRVGRFELAALRFSSSQMRTSRSMTSTACA